MFDRIKNRIEYDAMMKWFVLISVGLVLVGGLLYWLLVITEGVFLGRRLVVWLYDRTAHKYDGIKQFDADSEHFFVIRPLLQSLAAHPAPLVLDVATGTGRLPLFLLEVPTFNGRVIGLEPARKMLTLAQEKLKPFGYRVQFVRQTAVPLPFPDDLFHAVTCLEALEFMPDDVAALREMVRVLRPGGTLMVTRRQGWEAKTFFGRFRNREQFEDLLQDLGIVDVQIDIWQIDYDLVLGRKGDLGLEIGD